MSARSDLTNPVGDEKQLILKYRAVIHEIGPMVPEFLPHGILIFFNDSAPEELREVALIHDGTEPAAPLIVGDILRFSFPPSDDREQGEGQQQAWYRVTAVGEMANGNLASLGHLVVHFDGASTPTLPGTISVTPSLATLPLVGTTFELYGLKENTI